MSKVMKVQILMVVSIFLFLAALFSGVVVFFVVGLFFLIVGSVIDIATPRSPKTQNPV